MRHETLITTVDEQTAADAGRAPRVLRAAVERNGRALWWRRKGSQRRGFTYADAGGDPIRADAECSRIRALCIPPAWQEVRIAPSASSPLQAVGIDACRRIQYLYHADFIAAQQRSKYAKMERFGASLPALRRRANEDILLEGFSRDRVLAIVVRLINDLYFRLGTERNVARYHTFGITTLRNYHLHILRSGALLFRFTGKHHIVQRRLLADAELSAVLREIKALQGPRLFHYQDAGGILHPVTGQDVNHYIKQATGEEFTAKDFRTWGGTLKAAIALAELGLPDTETQRKRNITTAVKQVAEQLGNTPAVCRQSYIHPIVFERYDQGITLANFRRKAERILRHRQPEYDLEELELLKLFEEHPCS